MPDDRSETPQPPTPVVVPRWVQLVTLPLGVVALWIVARAAGPVLLVFVVASVVALILNPLVTLVQRARLPRGLSVAVVYLSLVGVVVAVGFALSGPIADQAVAIQKDVPDVVDNANAQLADLQRWLDDQGINIHVKRQGETAIQTLSDQLRGATGDIASTATTLVTTVVTAGFALVLILVVSIYMLLYGESIGALVRRVMPPGDGTPADDYPTRVQAAVSGYVRGQFLFSLAMGAGCGIGLYLLGLVGVFPAGRTYALAFAIFFGLMELIPYIGPFLGAVPPLLVAVFTDPLDVVWVGLFFVALQELEGHVVAPQIFSHTLRINPLLVIFALLMGGEVAGILGALLALPLAAILRETFIYLRRHLVLEQWGAANPVVAVLSAPPPSATAPPGEPPPLVIAAAQPHCPACGTAAYTGDAYCRACGTALAPPSGS
jgi:predicted PurR-regulated permease PerM